MASTNGKIPLIGCLLLESVEEAQVPETLSRLLEILQAAKRISAQNLKWIRPGPDGLVWQTTDGLVHREHRWSY